MMRAEKIIDFLESISCNPAQAVKAEMAKTGKKAVGCFPYYMPEELIYAAEMLPVGLWGGQSEIKLADKYLQSFCCSLMRQNVEQGMRGMYDFLSAVIIPTYCDTLKCVCENWKVAVAGTYLIPIVYPQNRRIQAGFEYLKAEYKRVQKELEAVAGRLINEQDLEKSLAVYDEYRKTMQLFTRLAAKYPQTITAKVRHRIIKASYFTDKKMYTSCIKDLIEALQSRPEEKSTGPKVVVTGIIAEPEGVLDVFVDNGVSFVADDLAQESRQFRTCFRVDGTALDRLALRIADQAGCSLLYDEEKSRGQMLVNMVRENNADGVVVFMMKFCDPEEFDYPIYKKELETAGIPLLYLEIEQRMDSVEQHRTRIQSFVEMLS